MNRLSPLFQKKKHNNLSIYFTAGYPNLHDTVPILESLQEAGVDFVEVGMPFSDPVADGPIIQHSSEVALANGMTVKLLFEQLKDIRKAVQIPLVLMGYINPVLQYGIERFCQKCAEVGIDGLILPDLPMQIYLDEYKPYFDQYGIRNIFLITPQSSEERVRWIDEHSDAFIYMVSSYSTTGAAVSGGFSQKQLEYFARIKALNLLNPTVVGFNISNAESFQTACDYANGAIIGSAFVKTLVNTQNIRQTVLDFVASIQK